MYMYNVCVCHVPTRMQLRGTCASEGRGLEVCMYGERWFEVIVVSDVVSMKMYPLCCTTAKLAGRAL